MSSESYKAELRQIVERLKVEGRQEWAAYQAKMKAKADALNAALPQLRRKHGLDAGRASAGLNVNAEPLYVIVNTGEGGMLGSDYQRANF